jgi:nitrogen fixation/metabolism regulation signal transduction histidine kinase
MENVLDNSLKANSSKIDIYLSRKLDGNSFVIDVVDNGNGLNHNKNVNLNNTLIPHGLGTKIISQNMRIMNARVEWENRLDEKGAIVRLIFPFIRKDTCPI